MKARQIVGWVLVGLFMALGVFIYFGLYGFSFSAYMCLGISFVLALYQLLAILATRQKKVAKLLRLILSTLLGLGLLLSSITGVYIASAWTQTPASGLDYIVVLGCGVRGSTPSIPFKERVNAAYAYLADNPETVCVVSGGQGAGENLSEAACMTQLLVDKGIDPERIWQEDQATNTRENLAYSLKLIESKTGARPESLGIVTSDFHVYRAQLTAGQLGIASEGIPAQTQWLALRLNYFMREIPGVWYYKIFGGN